MAPLTLIHPAVCVHTLKACARLGAALKRAGRLCFQHSDMPSTPFAGRVHTLEACARLGAALKRGGRLCFQDGNTPSTPFRVWMLRAIGGT